MNTEKINLKNHFPMLENDTFLHAYCPDNYLEFSKGRKRKCVLVLPGGGYAFLSDREAEPIALRFVGNDIAAFVLKYSIYPNIKYPNPFAEVFAAIAYIKDNADKFHIDEDKISVIGFSAGGHLAASCSANHENKEFADYLGINIEKMKINGCILGYPVISAKFGHMSSFEAFSGGNQELKEKFSIENKVTSSFPKTFIWHTTFDSVVSLKNSLLLAEALHENKVFLEMHVYPMLDHGQSLADESVYNDMLMSKENLQLMSYNTQWVDNAIHFIKHYI